MFVDFLLERQNQIRGALDFVDYNVSQAPDKAGRIVLSEPPGLVVVQRDEGPSFVIGYAPGKRRLAGLARPHDGDDAGVRQRKANARLGVPRYKGFGRERPVWHSLPSNSESASVQSGI